MKLICDWTVTSLAGLVEDEASVNATDNYARLRHSKSSSVFSQIEWAVESEFRIILSGIHPIDIDMIILSHEALF